MEKLKIGICDDNPAEQKRIAKAIEDGVRIIGVYKELDIRIFSNGQEMLEAERREGFHLVFLDIVIPSCDGFEIAAKINAEGTRPYIIFVSGCSDKVFNTYEYGPLTFVRKENLAGDICRGLQQYFAATTVKRINCKGEDGYRYREVLLADILYIECNGHTLSYQMRSGNVFLVYGSLKSIEGELSPYNIIRVHKNYLINLAYIERRCGNELILFNGMTVPMGKARRKKIDEAMTLYERRLRGQW